MPAQTLEPAGNRQGALFALAGALRGRAAMRPEIDDLLLMDAKNPETPTRREQRQVHEGAKAAVRDQDVAWFQVGMNARSLRHVVCAQGSGDDVQQEAGRGMKQGQEMHHRKAAAGLLSAGLAERLLQLRRVGHRDAGNIGEKGAMTMPAAFIEHWAGAQTMGEDTERIMRQAR